MIKYSSAILLIVITVCMPFACFAHPCGFTAYGSQAVVETVIGQADLYPQQLDLDDCDSTCCCAEYAPQEMHAGVFYAPVVTSLHRSDTYVLLPDVLTRIFVPPQNFSA